MEVPDYVEQLRRDGERLATVALFADPGAPVPTCPDWSLRDLVHRVGGVHRWATGFVRGAGRQPPDGDLERFVGGWPEDAELVAWFADGHRAIVGDDVLVRMHSGCVTGDALGSLRCECGIQLRHAFRSIDAGTAAVRDLGIMEVASSIRIERRTCTSWATTCSSLETSPTERGPGTSPTVS